MIYSLSIFLQVKSANAYDVNSKKLTYIVILIRLGFFFIVLVYISVPACISIIKYSDRAVFSCHLTTKKKERKKKKNKHNAELQRADPGTKVTG